MGVSFSGFSSPNFAAFFRSLSLLLQRTLSLPSRSCLANGAANLVRKLLSNGGVTHTCVVMNKLLRSLAALFGCLFFFCQCGESMKKSIMPSRLSVFSLSKQEEAGV
jgi:hypothetical protein